MLALAGSSHGGQGICYTLPNVAADKKADMKDQVVELLHLMLRRGLIERAERFYTKPKPGRKRLSRWPNKLKPVLRSEQVR